MQHAALPAGVLAAGGLERLLCRMWQGWHPGMIACCILRSRNMQYAVCDETTNRHSKYANESMMDVQQLLHTRAGFAMDVQGRSAICMVNGEAVAWNDERCQSSPQPTLRRPCIGSCAAAADFSFWLADNWGACKGEQSERAATCFNRGGHRQSDKVEGTMLQLGIADVVCQSQCAQQ